MLNRVKRCEKVPLWVILPLLAVLLFPLEVSGKRKTEPPRDSTDLSKYDFILSPAKIDKKDEYSRLDVESFMCAGALSFIRAEETIKHANGKYSISSETIGKRMIEEAKKQIISKWFENRVTVTVKGDANSYDRGVIKRFYRNINRIIKKKKFIFDPKLKVANIIIQLEKPASAASLRKYIGESAVLQDNLRVRISIDNENVKLVTYKSGSGKLINNSSYITLTPEELQFRRDNRMVKVYIRKVDNYVVLNFALIHEMLHTIGFPGHSPYYTSHLFPLPVQVYLWKPSSPFLAPLAEQMVEMLYRPEILPGMTLEEAGQVLSNLKLPKYTSKASTTEFLLKKKKQLEALKAQLLTKAKANYDKRMVLYMKLDKWANKEGQFLQELEEIKTAKKEDPKVVREINNATSYMFKLIRIRRELIIVKSMKNRLLEKIGNRKKNRAERRKLKFWNEELAVLNDLLKTAEKIGGVEREINATRAYSLKTTLEKQLQIVLRQIIFIDQQLNLLETKPA